MAWAEAEAHEQAPGALSPDLRRGLLAISTLAAVSFAASTAFFIYLTYRLLAWRRLTRAEQRPHAEQQPPRRRLSHDMSDFTLGIEGIFTDGHEPRCSPGLAPTPTLVLVYNLFLADVHQSLALLLDAVWLWRNGIAAPAPTCFAQGLLLSVGHLSSSIFITTIAVHAYLVVVQRHGPSYRAVCVAAICNWLFVYAISVVPILVTRNGGGFFASNGAWCWINKDYAQLRLATHYLFIFLGLGLTSTLYGAVFLSGRRQRSRARTLPFAESQASLLHEAASSMYPLIYILCTLPLALGRIAAMAAKDVPTGYFCFAGAIVALNGAFDCLLFATTRGAASPGPAPLSTGNPGFKTLTFLKTPSARRYGNMIWIQGGGGRGDDSRRGWWPWSRREVVRPRQATSCSTSLESLSRAAIQLDRVTSVVVEVDSARESWSRSRHLATASTDASVISTDDMIVLKE